MPLNTLEIDDSYSPTHLVVLLSCRRAEVAHNLLSTFEMSTVARPENVYPSNNICCTRMGAKFPLTALGPSTYLAEAAAAAGNRSQQLIG